MSAVRSLSLTDLGSSPCDTAGDLNAQRDKVDGLCQYPLRAAFQGFSLGNVIAVGGNHDDGNIRSCCLSLWQKFKAAHSRHVDVGQDQDQRRASGIIDVLKGAVG